jgi:hypothetical protein
MSLLTADGRRAARNIQTGDGNFGGMVVRSFQQRWTVDPPIPTDPPGQLSPRSYPELRKAALNDPAFLHRTVGRLVLSARSSFVIRDSSVAAGVWLSVPWTRISERPSPSPSLAYSK